MFLHGGLTLRVQHAESAPCQERRTRTAGDTLASSARFDQRARERLALPVEFVELVDDHKERRSWLDKVGVGCALRTFGERSTVHGRKRVEPTTLNEIRLQGLHSAQCAHERWPSALVGGDFTRNDFEATKLRAHTRFLEKV